MHILRTPALLIVSLSLCGLGCSRQQYQVPVIFTEEQIAIIKYESPKFSALKDASRQLPHINPYFYGDAEEMMLAPAPNAAAPGASAAPPADGSGKPARRPRGSGSFYSIARTPSNGEEARQARNMLQNAIVRASDEAIADHLAGMKVEESFWNTSLGLVTTALAGGATIASGGTATALAAGATVASGSRGIINEQEFRNTLVESIILLIQRDRTKALEEIRQNQAMSINQYDVERAIADAVDYHYRGSFYNGLALLVEAARKEGSPLEQSTVALVKAKSELAKLLGMGTNRAKLTEFLASSLGPKGLSDWIDQATAEQTGRALSYLRSQQAEGSGDLVRAETQSTDAEKAVAAAKDRVIKASEARSAAEAEISRVESQINDRQPEIARWETDLARLNGLYNDKHNEFMNAVDDAARDALRGAMEALQTEVADAKSHVEKGKEALDPLIKKKAELTGKLEASNKELEEAKAALIAAESTYRETQSKLLEAFIRERSAQGQPAPLPASPPKTSDSGANPK